MSRAFAITSRQHQRQQRPDLGKGRLQIHGERIEPRVNVVRNPAPDHARDRRRLAVAVEQARVYGAKENPRITPIELRLLIGLDKTRPVEKHQAPGADGRRHPPPGGTSYAQQAIDAAQSGIRENQVIASGAVFHRHQGLIGPREKLIDEDLLDQCVIEAQGKRDLARGRKLSGDEKQCQRNKDCGPEPWNMRGHIYLTRSIPRQCYPTRSICRKR